MADEKKLTCEDCGQENPEHHDYCFACGNYLRDDALSMKQLPKTQQTMIKALEQRLRPTRLVAAENRRLLTIGLSYLSISGAYLLIKMLPPWGGIEYIYLTLRLAEIALPMLLAFQMSNRAFRGFTLAYALLLLGLFIWQNFA